MKALTLSLPIIGIIFMVHGALVQFNRFLDQSPVQTEVLTIADKGIYYRPWPVDFVAGTSRTTGSRVRIPLSHEDTQKLAIGQQLAIVVGHGLFRKAWAVPADHYARSRALSFRVLYAGLLAVMLTASAFLYFRATRRGEISKRNFLGIFFGLLAAGFASFYLT